MSYRLGVMNAYQIVEQLKDRKGQQVRIAWQRAVRTVTGTPMLITKRTVAWVRAGIDYANLSLVREGIETGVRGVVKGLPWGKWAPFPFIIAHNSKEYVRLYPTSFENLATPQVEWFIDNELATYADVEKYLATSEKQETHEDKHPVCFTVRAHDVVMIGD